MRNNKAQRAKLLFIFSEFLFLKQRIIKGYQLGLHIIDILVILYLLFLLVRFVKPAPCSMRLPIWPMRRLGPELQNHLLQPTKACAKEPAKNASFQMEIDTEYVV